MRKIILGLFFFMVLKVTAQDYVRRNYSALNELIAKDSYHHANGELFVVDMFKLPHYRVLTN